MVFGRLFCAADSLHYLVATLELGCKLLRTF